MGLRGVSVSDALLPLLVSSCVHLLHLNVSYNEKISDSGILTVARGLPGLRSIAIGGNEQLTDSSLVHLTEHCTHSLQVLRMNRFGSVRVSVFVNLMQNCINLHTLSTNLQLNTSIVPHLHRLRTFLSWAVCTDKFLIALAQHCQHLEVLNIAHNLALVTVGGGGVHVHIPTNTSTDAQKAEMLHPATPRTSAGVVPYTEKGLLALMRGLPNLRVLGVTQDASRNTFAQLAVSVWQELCPGLQVTSESVVDAFEYKVLEQEV